MEVFSEVILMMILYTMMLFTDFAPDLEIRPYIGYVSIAFVAIHLIVLCIHMKSQLHILFNCRGGNELKDVGGQIAQLRAQLLRSEQEMHLMRSKLEEEKTERRLLIVSLSWIVLSSTSM